MPVVTIVCGSTSEKIHCSQGSLLSDVVLEQGHTIKMPCAGKGICKKCRVKVQGLEQSITAMEQGALLPQEIQEGIRLACCATVTKDCTVWLAQEKAAQICGEGELPDFEKSPIFQNYGIAIDIGTTTLAARLYNKDMFLEQSTQVNPQRVFGADVISRIEASLNGKAPQLASTIRTAINQLIEDVCGQANISPQQVDGMVIVGNTAMLYLLCQYPVDSIAKAPFRSEHLFDCWLQGKDLDLICPHCRVYLPPCMGAFVGADTTAAILGSSLCESQDTQLLVDIGTNGEMALWQQDKLLCCSTAAGTAFEGVGLWMGMEAKEGAIDHVEVKQGAVVSHALGEIEPVGLCGSGAVDAVACGLQVGIIEESGYMEDVFWLSEKVGINQKDVRMIQLAKGAIFAGMESLLEDAKVDFSAVKAVKVAGGFGNYLNLQNAAAIGLLPKELLPVSVCVGNAALTGASMLLLNEHFIKKMQALTSSAKCVDLAANPFFQDAFVEAMLFE